MQAILRDIDAGDLEVTQALVREYLQETPFFSRVPFSANETADSFFKALSNHRAYVRIAYYREEVAGVFWGGIGTFFGTKVLFAYDTFCFIRSKFRGKKIADILLNDFETWAISNGCEFVRFVACFSANNDGVHKFLTNAGYKQSGTNLIKAL